MPTSRNRKTTGDAAAKRRQRRAMERGAATLQKLAEHASHDHKYLQCRVDGATLKLTKHANGGLVYRCPKCGREVWKDEGDQMMATDRISGVKPKLFVATNRLTLDGADKNG